MLVRMGASSFLGREGRLGLIPVFIEGLGCVCVDGLLDYKALFSMFGLGAQCHSDLGDSDGSSVDHSVGEMHLSCVRKHAARNLAIGELMEVLPHCLYLLNSQAFSIRGIHDGRLSLRLSRFKPAFKTAARL